MQRKSVANNSWNKMFNLKLQNLGNLLHYHDTPVVYPRQLAIPFPNWKTLECITNKHFTIYIAKVVDVFGRNVRHLVSIYTAAVVASRLYLYGMWERGAAESSRTVQSFRERFYARQTTKTLNRVNLLDEIHVCVGPYGCDKLLHWSGNVHKYW